MPTHRYSQACAVLHQEWLQPEAMDGDVWTDTPHVIERCVSAACVPRCDVGVAAAPVLAGALP